MREVRELGPRTARLVVGAVLASLSALYALTAVGRPVPETVWAGGLCGCVLLVWLRPVFRGRSWTPWALAALAVPAYAAVLSAQVSVGLLGMLGGALFAARQWWATGLVAASAPVIAMVRDGAVAHVVDTSLTAVLTGVLVVGLTRLLARIDERSATRMALSLAAVEEERLRVAAELDESIGKGLETVARAGPGDLDATLEAVRESLAGTRAAAVELRSLSLAPEIAAARGLLASAGIEAKVSVGHTEPLGRAGSLLAVVLREAVTGVVRQGGARSCEITTVERDDLLVLRIRNDGVRTVEQGAAALEGPRERLEAAGGRLRAALERDGRFLVEASVRAPRERRPVAEPTAERRLAVALLAATLAVLCVKGLLQAGPGVLPVAVPCLAAAVAIQLRWTRRPGPRWGVLLAAQAVLSFAPIAVLGEPWGTLPGLLAGSVLVLLPARTAWPVAAAVTACAGAAAWAGGIGPAMLVNTVVSVPVTGLVVYGLLRLARLADELRDAAALARAAVVQERLRTARDLHDLLGHTLAALLIKGELARRLADRDPGRAAAEFAGMVAMAERAREDMRTVAGAAPRLELDPELDSARGVLEAAGIEVTLVRDGAPPPDAEAVLATVLREAVTNILRHSAARHVRIAVSDHGVTVSNDGAPAEVTPPGSGLGNLTTRLAARGGRLRAERTPGGGFRLTATLD